MSSKFSAEERKAFTDAFVLFDRDGSGTIDIAEFADVAAELNIGMTLQEVQELIATVDTDGSGEIDLEEFLTIMAQKLHHGGDVDTDDDGGSEGDDEEDELWIALGSMPAQEDAGESPMFDPGAHRRPTFEALSVHELHFRAGKLQTFCEELVHAMAVERDESAATPSGATLVRAACGRRSKVAAPTNSRPGGRASPSRGSRLGRRSPVGRRTARRGRP